MSAIYIAGFGCRRGCSAAVLRDLLENALREYAIDVALLSGLASIDSKRDEAGLLELAAQLQLPLYFFAATQLTAYQQRLTQYSPIALATTGVAGVAEAAALAQAELLVADARAELIIEKHSNGAATFALARSARATPPRESQ